MIPDFVNNKLKGTPRNSLMQNGETEVLSQVLCRLIAQGTIDIPLALPDDILKEEDSSFLLAYLLARTAAKAIEDLFDHHSLIHASFSEQNEIVSVV